MTSDAPRARARQHRSGLPLRMRAHGEASRGTVGGPSVWAGDAAAQAHACDAEGCGPGIWQVGRGPSGGRAASSVGQSGGVAVGRSGGLGQVGRAVWLVGLSGGRAVGRSAGGWAVGQVGQVGRAVGRSSGRAVWAVGRWGRRPVGGSGGRAGRSSPAVRRSGGVGLAVCGLGRSIGHSVDRGRGSGGRWCRQGSRAVRRGPGVAGRSGRRAVGRPVLLSDSRSVGWSCGGRAGRAITVRVRLACQIFGAGHSHVAFLKDRVT